MTNKIICAFLGMLGLFLIGKENLSIAVGVWILLIAVDVRNNEL